MGPAQAQRVREIKDTVRSSLALADGVVVLVTELKCSEPGCPPVETIVALLGADGRNLQTKIHQPVIAIRAEQLQDLCRQLRQNLAHSKAVNINDTTEETCDGH